LRVLLLTDVVDSTRIVGRLGDLRAAQLFAQIDRVARDLLNLHHGREIDRTDGFLMLFERPIDAVRYALSLHGELHLLGQNAGLELRARCGIHLGEVVLHENTPEDVARGAKPLEVEGLAKPLAARVMSVALGGQTLVTRSAYDLARRSAVGSESLADTIAWVSHGTYELKGVDEPVELFEVGLRDIAPLAPPPNSDKVRRISGPHTPVGATAADESQPPTRALAATPLASESLAEMPRQFGAYELREQLGQGGMGVVYKAWDKHLDRPAAIKVLSPMIRAMPGAIERLKAEARAAARLHHPSIVPVYAYGEDGGWSWIAMEFVEGRDLSKMVRTEGAMEPRRALRYMRQCAEGLEFAAREKIVHRDIKPANILVNNRDEARVMDFGLAKRMDVEKGLTATGSTLGTPDYMSPEQALARPVDHRSDIYSLGCTLYALLSGRPPFGGASAMEVMMRHVQDPLPVPPAWKNFAGGRVVKLLERMTQKDVAQRFQNWTDVVAEMKAVEEALAKSPLAPAALALPPLIGSAAPPAKRKGGAGVPKKALVAGGIVLAVAVVGGMAAVLLSGDSGSRRYASGASSGPLPTPTPVPTAVPPPPTSAPLAAPSGFANPELAKLAALLSAGQWDAAESAVQAVGSQPFAVSRVPADTMREELVECIGIARSFETGYLPSTGTPVGDPLQRTLDILGDVDRRSQMSREQAWAAVLYLILRRQGNALDFAATLGGNLGSGPASSGAPSPGPEVGKRMFKLFAMGVLLQPDRAQEWSRIGPPDGQRPPAGISIPGGGNRRPAQQGQGRPGAPQQ